MPVRFTSPSLGGQRETFFRPGEWQIGVAYRRLWADQWFVGTQVNEAAAPFGQPLYLNINSLDLSVTRGLTDRVSVTLTLPLTYGTHSRFYADNQRHKVGAIGLSDISLVGNGWLLRPATHAGGNISLGFGVKAPTGSNHATDDFFLADGSVVQRPVDQSIQLGDGGWGIMVQLQAFQQILSSVSVYLIGQYLLSPRDTTEVPSPLPGVTLSVPDVYSARAGVAYVLVPRAGISASLGGRIDGIPRRDLIGAENGFRRPGYTLYLDPGLSLTRGPHEFTLNIPVRIHQNFQQSLMDQQHNFRGGGDLADYLVFTGYTYRF